MAKIKFITDSASDITAEQEAQFDIKIMNFKVAMGDNSYVSRVDFDNEKFYKMMDEFDGIPVTSQVTAFEYSEVFEQLYAEKYTDVINITINSKGSATFNNAVMAANEFYENHPEAKGVFTIYNIDSESYTGAYGYPILQGAIKAAKGVPAADIAAFIEDWVKNCVIFFAPYTLKYAKKSGRIPSAAAFVGEVMGLRPIMRIHDHAIVTETKVRGDKAIVPKILDLTVKEMIPQTPYSIVYGSDESVRDEMAQAMTKKVGYPPAECFQIGAAIAINAGPKVTGVIFKARSGK
ncbi:DegV family protein [Ruminococcus sp.]|uniref:DegV family protein n=1 Tax=Ruminococcus sp. TaxID=41978 RepID=UPI0025FA362C|nr:DegV family protein [Ruminococcus sp.]